MEYLILFVFLLCAAHWFIESAVSPSVRMLIRFHLFEIRDDLRNLKIEAPESMSDEVFDILNESLNDRILYQKMITPSFLVRAYRYVNEHKEEAEKLSA